MGWNALIDPRTAPGFGQAALGGVVILAITGIYGWYAHLHVLPIYWDTVVVALMTMGGLSGYRGALTLAAGLDHVSALAQRMPDGYGGHAAFSYCR